jgi:hypothetical protein
VGRAGGGGGTGAAARTVPPLPGGAAQGLVGAAAGYLSLEVGARAVCVSTVTLQFYWEVSSSSVSILYLKTIPLPIVQ